MFIMNLIIAYVVLLTGSLFAVPEAEANMEAVHSLFSQYVDKYFIYRNMSYESEIPEITTFKFTDAAAQAHEKANRDESFAADTKKLQAQKSAKWNHVQNLKKDSYWPKDYCTGSVMVDDFGEGSQFYQIYWDMKDKSNPEAEKETLPANDVKTIVEFTSDFSEEKMERITKVAKTAHAINIGCEVDEIWCIWKGFTEKSKLDSNSEVTRKYIYCIMTQATEEEAEEEAEAWDDAEELDETEESDECFQDSTA